VRPILALCVDVPRRKDMARSLAESQRMGSYDHLLQRIKEHEFCRKIPSSGISIFLRKFGGVPHGAWHGQSNVGGVDLWS